MEEKPKVEEMKVEMKVEEGEGGSMTEGAGSSHPPPVTRQPEELPKPLSDELMQEVCTAARATFVALCAALAGGCILVEETQNTGSIGGGEMGYCHVRVATRGGAR